MKFIISMFLLVLMIPLVFAVYSVTQTAPAAYAIMNNTKVTFAINATGNNVSFNCSLYTKLSSGANFTENATFGATNNTDTGQLVNLTFPDSSRVWWKVGCYDRVGGTTTNNEQKTVPAQHANVDFANDGDGVETAVGWVNYTQPLLSNESIASTPANNSQVALAQNGSIASINGVLATIHTTVNNGSATIPANNSVVQVTYNTSVVSVASALVNSNGTHNWTIGSANYSVVGGRIYWNTTDFLGNESWWTYNYESNTTVSSANYALSGGIVTMASDTYSGNTSYWDYEFYNQTGLVLNTDYNITNNLVYMKTATYAGDTSYWNYTYPGTNKLNEVNSSVRILDVDDYYNEYLEIFTPIKITGQAAAPTCDTTSAGAIYYDSDDFKHFGCNSTDWVAMYN